MALEPKCKVLYIVSTGQFCADPPHRLAGDRDAERELRREPPAAVRPDPSVVVPVTPIYLPVRPIYFPVRPLEEFKLGYLATSMPCRHRLGRQTARKRVFHCIFRWTREPDPG